MKKKLDPKAIKPEVKKEEKEEKKVEAKMELAEKEKGEPKEGDKILKIKLDDVNQFLNLVGVIMLDDPRDAVIKKHFINIIKGNNPELK